MLTLPLRPQYYLRTRAAAAAIQFTVDKKLQDEAKAANKAAKAPAGQGSPAPPPYTEPISSVTSSPVVVSSVSTSAASSPSVDTVSASVGKMSINGASPLAAKKWSGPAAGSAPSPLAQRIAALNAASTASSSSSSSSSSPAVGSENEDLSFEEAKRRAAERQLEQEKAALAEDDGACVMCSG